eukprot:379549-Rhodomonas_salina.1
MQQRYSASCLTSASCPRNESAFSSTLPFLLCSRSVVLLVGLHHQPCDPCSASSSLLQASSSSSSSSNPSEGQYRNPFSTSSSTTGASTDPSPTNGSNASRDILHPLCSSDPSSHSVLLLTRGTLLASAIVPPAGCHVSTHLLPLCCNHLARGEGRVTGFKPAGAAEDRSPLLAEGGSVCVSVRASRTHLEELSVDAARARTEDERVEERRGWKRMESACCEVLLKQDVRCC